MPDLRMMRCPRPEHLISRYLNGSSIKSLVDDAYRSKVFAKKENARNYVHRVIYEYNLKEGRENNE